MAHEKLLREWGLFGLERSLGGFNCSLKLKGVGGVEVKMELVSYWRCTFRAGGNSQKLQQGKHGWSVKRKYFILGQGL